MASLPAFLFPSFHIMLLFENVVYLIVAFLLYLLVLYVLVYHA